MAAFHTRPRRRSEIAARHEIESNESIGPRSFPFFPIQLTRRRCRRRRVSIFLFPRRRARILFRDVEAFTRVKTLTCGMMF